MTIVAKGTPPLEPTPQLLVPGFVKLQTILTRSLRHRLHQVRRYGFSPTEQSGLFVRRIKPCPHPIVFALHGRCRQSGSPVGTTLRRLTRPNAHRATLFAAPTDGFTRSGWNTGTIHPKIQRFRLIGLTLNKDPFIFRDLATQTLRFALDLLDADMHRSQLPEKVLGL